MATLPDPCWTSSARSYKSSDLARSPWAFSSGRVAGDAGLDEHLAVLRGVGEALGEGFLCLDGSLRPKASPNAYSA